MGWIQELDIAMDKRPLLKWLVYPTLIILLIGVAAFAFVFIKAASDGRGVTASTGSITPNILKLPDTTESLTALKQEPLPVYKKEEHPIEKNKTSQRQIKEPVKSDSSTGSKYNLQSSTFNAPTQIGDNNTQTNIGDLPRIITASNFNSFFTQVTDKNVRIQVDFIGLSANKEMANVKSQILQILSDNGYKNLEYKSGYRVLSSPVSDVFIQKEKDGTYVFCVPPK